MTLSTPDPLTARQQYALARQQQVLDWIGAYVRTNGRPPSYRDIASGLAMGSHSVAQHHLNSLRRLGRIRWEKGLLGSLQFHHPDGTWHTTPPPAVK
jgi:SOS-response transcriptional repressor LexA